MRIAKSEPTHYSMRLRRWLRWRVVPDILRQLYDSLHWQWCNWGDWDDSNSDSNWRQHCFRCNHFCAINYCILLLRGMYSCVLLFQRFSYVSAVSKQAGRENIGLIIKRVLVFRLLLFLHNPTRQRMTDFNFSLDNPPERQALTAMRIQLYPLWVAWRWWQEAEMTWRLEPRYAGLGHMSLEIFVPKDDPRDETGIQQRIDTLQQTCPHHCQFMRVWIGENK